MKARLLSSSLFALAACSGHATHANAPEASVGTAASGAPHDAGPARASDAATAAAATAPSAPPPGTLDESMAKPYFPDAGARFALEDWTGARALYAQAQAAAPAGDDATRARATLMLGLCDGHLAQWPQAADEIVAAAPQLPALADWLRYQEARARYFAHQLDRAAALAKQVSPDSIAGADAEMLVGDVLRTGTDAAARSEERRV